MSRRVELIALLVIDALMFSLAYALLYLARFKWQWFGQPKLYPMVFWLPMLLMTAYWVLLFAFSGMYRERYAASRFDELVSLFKVVTVGVLILVFAIFIDTLEPSTSREAIFFYWASVYGLVSAGRLGVRTVQKALLLRGYGVHKALVVGWSDKVAQLYEEVRRYPEAGLKIVGAIRLARPGEPAESQETTGDGAAVAAVQVGTSACTIEALPRLIDELGVQDVLIALDGRDHDALLEVLRLCDGKPVKLKLVPDFYTLIGGMARTEHMYGLPLIEVLPEPMPAWEQSMKRVMDVTVSLAVLGLGLPLWIVIGLLIRLTSPGPAIYRQQRVGQHGRIFTLYKFRTMYVDAEARTGPVWAAKDDPRVTPIGRWLRRWRLDEVPQFWNVLKGEMSLVGPRPERPYFVEKLSQEIPLYNRRHRVKPGITGWAQVRWKYDNSLDDVRQKVKFDLFYIENMSLRMDLKILFRTIYTMLAGKGQ
ncbi:sugar transferase [Rhodothermus profundi]|uniref:Undecaprenyl-phosphate glucose phosphotransferase n=1 Tax=Rhodothermus profundi TaxID=633813 RepID=A0A1M6PYL6_9BACT|nr:sugar transferase [Rhodothermus profundi]SHK13053.1 Undecaprenyl-phosphate glucose phosphotransferase [Rhodothermus profundi]